MLGSVRGKCGVQKDAARGRAYGADGIGDAVENGGALVICDETESVILEIERVRLSHCWRSAARASAKIYGCMQ